MVTFRTTLLQQGNNVGISVPEEIVLGFGAGKRVPVKVTLNGYSYDSTIAVMRGRYMIGVAAVHRAASGVKGGDELEVTLDHDAAPRTVELPDDLVAALDAAGAREGFDALAFTFRKEHVRSISEAKAADTRERRLAKAVDAALEKAATL